MVKVPQYLGCELWQPAFCVRYGHQHLPFSWECFLSEKHAKLHSFKKQRRDIPAAKDAIPASQGCIHMAEPCRSPATFKGMQTL